MATAYITFALFVLLTTTACVPCGTAAPRKNALQKPASVVESVANPLATAGTLVPPYVTDVAVSVFDVALKTKTRTPLTPEAAPVWFHVNEASLTLPVVVCDSVEVSKPTAI